LLLLAAVTAAPAGANELAAPPLPAAGETILIPAQPFLEQLDTEPDVFEALVTRVRDLKRFMRRQLAALERALQEEQASSIVESAALDPEEAKRDAQRRVAAAIEPEGAEIVLHEPRNLPEAFGIGLHDSALLAFDAPEDGAALPGVAGGSDGVANPGLRPPPQPGRADLFSLALDALRWLRREPLLTALILSSLALFAWTRHMSARRT
jgi:hypothetical protein